MLPTVPFGSGGSVFITIRRSFSYENGFFFRTTRSIGICLAWLGAKSTYFTGITGRSPTDARNFERVN